MEKIITETSKLRYNHFGTDRHSEVRYIAVGLGHKKG